MIKVSRFAAWPLTSLSEGVKRAVPGREVADPFADVQVEGKAADRPPRLFGPSLP